VIGGGAVNDTIVDGHCSAEAVVGNRLGGVYQFLRGVRVEFAVSAALEDVHNANRVDSGSDNVVVRRPGNEDIIYVTSVRYVTKQQRDLTCNDRGEHIPMMALSASDRVHKEPSYSA
jgi:hypothetical protein